MICYKYEIASDEIDLLEFNMSCVVCAQNIVWQKQVESKIDTT